MLRRMSGKQLLLWHAYAQVEPFGEWWASLRTASILQMLANINRDSKKRPEPFKLEDFVLKLEGSQATTDKPFRRQTPKQQAQILRMWIDTLEAQRKEKKRRMIDG